MSASRERAAAVGDVVVLDVAGLDRLIRRLTAAGYRAMGPVLREGAVMTGEIEGVADLPRGVRDEQAPGRYRVRDAADQRLFDWAVGPGSWKPQFFPASDDLWHAPGAGDVRTPRENEIDGAPVAVIGARPCDAAALGVLDRVLLGGTFVDERYGTRRADSLLVVAECASPSSLCFCPSTETGPDARGDFDLAMMEIDDEAGHRFVVRVASERGAAALGSDFTPATGADVTARDRALDASRERIARSLDTREVAAALARNTEHPRWAEVAERCLSCGNCTLVCPTCFCSDVRDTTDFSGAARRTRRWSSCFDLEHSYLHGGPVHSSVSSRYRQWLTHKLSTWWDQFDTTGCVGCGRCVAWCPVGIDLLEEAAAIVASDGATAVATPTVRSTR